VSDVKARIGHSRTTHHRRPRPLWEGDTRGSEVVALMIALTLTSAAAEIAVASRLGWFFDVCFVAICLLSALLVRPRDFFNVGVLPPLLMLGTMLVVALNGARVIAARHDSVVQAVVTGLAHHSVALFVGYALCLVTLVLRQRALR
jgi:hypothetical protein